MELSELRPAWSMSDSEVLTTLDQLHAESATKETYRLQLLADLDQRGYAKELGARDLVELLSMRHRLDKPAVRRDLKLAKALPIYPAVTAALPDPLAPTSPDGGLQYPNPNTDTTADADRESAPADSAEAAELLPVLLHPAQANAIVSALADIPTTAMIPIEDLRVAEEQMVEAARFLAPRELRDLGKKIRDRLDTDGSEPAEDAAYRKEALRLRPVDHGITFSGFLANENAEALKTAIHALSKPHKTIDGELDPRSRDKRQADALTTILGIAAGAGDSGHRNLAMTVTIDYDDLKNAVTTADTTDTSSASGASGASGASRASGATGTAGHDGIGPTGGMGELIYGDNLSAAATRRLACDANILPIVLGSDSVPLDVGMEQRFVNRLMRRALIRRDKGCVVCKAPPIHCEAHHLNHWIDGGPTALWNLVLLCKAHHIALHHGHWTIEILNGVVHVTRPTWAEPTRGPWRPHPKPEPPPRTTNHPAEPGATGGPDATGNTATPMTPATATLQPVRAWPPTGDVPWITPEEAARLNPWGDDVAPTPAVATHHLEQSTAFAPWDDENTTSSPGP